MKKHFSGRVISFVLALSMLISILPMTVLAKTDTEIDTIEVDVIAPVKGATPSFTAAFPDDANYTLHDRDDFGYVNGVMWEGYYENSSGEVTNKYTMDADDTFLSGYHYIATVLVEPKDGYYFYYAPDNFSTEPDVTVTMNGETATYNKDSSWLIVQHTFYVPMEVITYGFTQQPVGGEVYPNEELTVTWATDFTPTKIEIHTVVSASSFNLVKTLDGTTTSTSLYYSKFPYIVVAYYNSENGETFKVSNPFTITEKEIVEITAVEVNIPAPVGGNKPSYDATVPADAGYSVKMEYINYYTKGVMWETNREWMSGNTEYVAGQEYVFTVLLKSKDGYEFRRDVTEPDLDIKVNGNSNVAICDFYDMGNDIIMVQCLFTAADKDQLTVDCSTAIDYLISGDVLIVDATIDCKVGYIDGDKYVEITSTGNFYAIPAGATKIVIRFNGDINNDATVDISDATILYNALKGKATLEAGQKFMIDVNGDGSYNIIDVMMTLNKI